MKVCSVPGCPELTDRGACERHRREQDRSVKDRQPWRLIYRTERWQRLRRQVLREQPLCATEGCGQPSEVVDHVIPLVERIELAFERVNLQGLCADHHNSKTRLERVG